MIIVMIGCGSLYIGAVCANVFVESFGLTGWWCLLGALPLLAVSAGVSIVATLGLRFIADGGDL